MKSNLLNTFLFTLVASTSIQAMEDLPDGTTRDQYIALRNSAQVNLAAGVGLTRDGSLDLCIPRLVGDDYRTICMDLFNKRDAYVRTVVKKTRDEIRSERDQYIKELIDLKSQKQVRTHSNENDYIAHKDQDDKIYGSKIATKNTIVKKQLLEKKAQHAEQQIDAITRFLEGPNINEEAFGEEWIMIDEAEDTSYTQLTTGKRAFLMKQEAKLQQDANSFYNKYRLDRLSAKERYDLMKEYARKKRNVRIGLAVVGVAGGVSLIGIATIAKAYFDLSTSYDNLLQIAKEELQRTDRLLELVEESLTLVEETINKK